MQKSVQKSVQKVKDVCCNLLLQNGTIMSVKHDGTLRRPMKQADRDVAVMRLGNELLRGGFLTPVFCSQGVVLVDARCSELHQNESLQARPLNNNRMLWELIGKFQNDKVYGDALFVPKELVHVQLYDKFVAAKQVVCHSTQQQNGSYKQGTLRNHVKRKRSA
jgi:hypothetical protein